jgi:hypothetical protein
MCMQPAMMVGDKVSVTLMVAGHPDVTAMLPVLGAQGAP